MEHQTGQIQTGSSSGEFAEQEEAGTREVAPTTETLGKIAVDAGETKAIVKGQQQEGDDNIAGEETQAHLEIGHATRPDPTRYTDKAHAADAGAYHAKGDEQPRRFPASAEEGVVVAIGLHKLREDNQQKHIKCQSGEYQII